MFSICVGYMFSKSVFDMCLYMFHVREDSGSFEISNILIDSWSLLQILGMSMMTFDAASVGDVCSVEF